MRYSVAKANIRHWRGIYRQSRNPERVMVHAVVRLQAHAGNWKQRADKAEQRIAELEAGQRNARELIDSLQSERERMNKRAAELEAQLAAVPAYANYHHDARTVWFAVGRPRSLTFDEWWQTPHCPECGRLELDRGVGEDGAERWECAGVDGCGYSWPVEVGQ